MNYSIFPSEITQSLGIYFLHFFFLPHFAKNVISSLQISGHGYQELAAVAEVGQLAGSIGRDGGGDAEGDRTRAPLGSRPLDALSQHTDPLPGMSIAVSFQDLFWGKSMSIRVCTLHREN